MRLVVFLIVMLGTFPAWAEKRVALVIGNNAYETLPPLQNAKKDAQDMAAKLKGLGFDVILQTNASKRDIGRALADFEGRLAGADAGLVFYAGHGIQADGINYLVPSDSRIEEEADLRFEGINSQEFLLTMKNAGAPVNVVILDACRDNPLPKRSRSGVRGLAVQAVPTGVKGVAMLYSAGPGETAADGALGGNGVFTGELLKSMDAPGKTIEQVFKDTARRVNVATHGKQTPWINASLTGDFYFQQGNHRPSQATLPVAPQNSAEVVFWQSISNSQNASDYEAYLQQFPQGTFAPLAKSRVQQYRVAEIVPPKPPKPTSQARKSGGGSNAGEVFRDCAECPEMVIIPPGSFRMGDLSGDGRDDEKPVHTVKIGYSFAVSRYEVTLAEWGVCVRDGVCDGDGTSENRGPSYDEGWGRGDRPVINANWNDVQKYVKWLNGKTGHEYRLMSESEWEYVARAGAATRWSCGDSTSCLNDVAWYRGNSASFLSYKTHPVGGKTANAFGVHDMHGNASEWVEDCYRNSYRGAPTDGSAMTEGKSCHRVARGGGYMYVPNEIRSAIRIRRHPDTREGILGFRLARVL
ncbi:SUMF1/EgtB/PvdO family nonheme iron enzyme [Magnetovibrio sp. PR-2]|uniref:SUMF1/EgtB/PvdO family nonheme iron enzyme n=1 Tax=Magnetovibrio sp. PR-2 TaxID=3120356 RepID=UPI002FCE6362